MSAPSERLSVLLNAVQEAAENRSSAALIGREADADFRDALRAAHAGGHSLSEIGRACGLTKQGVRWLIRREETKA